MKMRSSDTLLVCAYDDEAKCRQTGIDGAISHAELQRRLPQLAKDRNLVFYCA